MSDAGKRLISSAKQARATVRSAFNDHATALSHFQYVRRWLTDNYISEDCARDFTVGCASCEAIMLRQQLDMFIREIEDDFSDPTP